MTRVVVTLAALLLLAGCAATPAPADPAPSDGPVTSATPSPTPSETTVAPAFIVDDPARFAVPDWEGVHFVSPSANIGCAILGPEQGYLWGCAIAEMDWEFPTDSPDDFCYDAQVPCGGGIEGDGADLPHPRYRGDPGFPAAMEIGGASGNDFPVLVLPYGHSVGFGDVTCVSEEAHVTCTNATSGHGFVISRNENTIF